MAKGRKYIPPTDPSEYVSLPSMSEVAKSLMEREYKVKKLLFAGAVFSMDPQGRFMIINNGDLFTDYDYGFVIEHAYYELKTDREDDGGLPTNA